MTIKTNSGTKKRVKVTGRKKFKLAKSNKRHLLSNKSKKAKKNNANGLIVSSSERKRIKNLLPHI